MDSAFAYTRMSGTSQEPEPAGIPHSASASSIGEQRVASPANNGWGSTLIGQAPYADNRAVPGRAVAKRHKKGRLMKWLVLYSLGGKQYVTLDKRQLIDHFRLDIPVRDMRLMDSVLGNSYEVPGQLLVREDALVFSMEYVRLIITADKVLVPLDDEKIEGKERFLCSLESSLHDWQQQERPSSVGAAGPDDNEPKRRLDDEALPFELHVLEIALGEVCAHLSREATALHAAAGPVLDDLTKDSNTLNLERVRRVKTAQSRLAGRVKAMGESLEKLMEDDQDMWRMCLTRSAARQQQQKQPSGGVDQVAVPSTTPGPRSLLSTGRRYSLNTKHERSFSEFAVPPDLVFAATAEDNMHDVSDVEALLESYFILVDSTFQSLSRLGEYIQDTEELISMSLDWSRNKLIRFEIMLTTGTFVLALFSAVAGVLGENLAIPEAWTQDISGFIIINTTAGLLALACFCLVVSGLRVQKLI